MYSGEDYYSDATTTEAEISASVRLRDVTWLKRAFVAAVASLSISSKWRVHSEAARPTVEDYANEILDSLTFTPDVPAVDYIELAAVTTAALQTVTITGLRSNAGAFTVNFGDNYTASYPAGYTGFVARTYTAAGVYKIRVNAPRASITHLVCTDAKLVIPIGAVASLSGLQVLQIDGMNYAFVAANELSGKYSLSYLYIRNAPNVAHLSALQSLPALSTVRITNGLTAAQVSDVLYMLWGQSNIKTSNGGSVNVGGTNAVCGGTYNSACPPTNGLQYRYQLLLDTCGTFINSSRRWSEVIVN